MAVYPGDSELQFYLLEKGRFVNDKSSWVTAPLWQQAFRWFREKHNLDSFVKAEWQQTVKVGYYFSVNDYYSAQPSHLTYEEAQLECLKKLLLTLSKN